MAHKKVSFQQRTKNLNSRVAFFVPHSFLFPLILTFAAYVMGIFWAYQGPFDMVQFWIRGFWSFLSFSMQMVLMVVAAFSVACSPAGQKALRFLASIPRSPRSAIMFMTATVSLISWVFWGVGMVVGIFLAREMGRRIARLDYPLLVAGAYIGMCTGTFGLFASEPLASSKPGHSLEKVIGLIPMSQTALSTMTVAAFCLGTLAVTILMGFICPKEEDAIPPPPEILQRFELEDLAERNSLAFEKELRLEGMPLGVWLEHSRWPIWLISIIGYSYIVYWFYIRGLDLDLNILNFTLLSLALSLHDTPIRFLESMERSTRAAYGIIVQFPFYAGIQGMLASSGVAAIIFGWVTIQANEATYPIWVYIDAAVVNFFVPTSTGIWEIQGPLVVKTAQSLQASIPQAINAFTAGEVIGNLIQPFWAIPLLAVCGLPLRAIMGYCLLAFFVLSLIWILCVSILPI
ncbi:MAG: TIGR00366 family protein [Deltaproteobacteria bacterium]|nr:TIGR00366 family protein [Deltaproteobacteria bacterium]